MHQCDGCRVRVNESCEDPLHCRAFNQSIPRAGATQSHSSPPAARKRASSQLVRCNDAILLFNTAPSRNTQTDDTDDRTVDACAAGTAVAVHRAAARWTADTGTKLLEKAGSVGVHTTTARDNTDSTAVPHNMTQGAVAAGTLLAETTTTIHQQRRPLHSATTPLAVAVSVDACCCCSRPSAEMTSGLMCEQSR